MPIKQLHYRLAEIGPMIGLSENTVRKLVDELGITPARIPAGSSTRPVYSLDQVLQLAKAKRARHKQKFQRPIVISVYVPKGGVGKSTITNELGADFTLQGYNTLMVDLDDQASLTIMNGYQPDEVPDAEKPNPWLVENTLLSALYPSGRDTASVPLREIVLSPYGPHGQRFVPADITLGELGYRLTNQANRERFLRNWIATQGERDLKDYDIVLIDNAPSTSVVSRASMVAADLLLIPVRLDALTVKSISFLARELNNLAEAGLEIPQVIAVPNFFLQNNSRSARVMSALQTQFGDEVPIAPHIGQSERFPQSLLAVGRELEEVLPVTYENWNRGYERQHNEIRAVAKFVLEIAERSLREDEQPALFDDQAKSRRSA